MLKYRTVYMHMQEFLDFRYHVMDIARKELTPAFISDFEMFRRPDTLCCTNTVWLDVCPVRTVVFGASNNEWLSRVAVRVSARRTAATPGRFRTPAE
ncbi:phage integrase SAM-like domain-containing protein, partial [Ornithobacterium rhinotracheale]